MNATTITCPNCEHEFEISDALLKPLRDQMEADVRQQRAQVAEQKAEVRRRFEELQRKGEDLDEEIEKQAEKKGKEIAGKFEEKLKEKYSIELNDRNEQIEQYKNQVREFQKQELALRNRERKLKEREEQSDLEIARQIDTERATIRTAAKKQADEENELKIAEKDKKISDMAKKITDLKRESEQGSQQTQGEVLELGLEGLLRREFPSDIVVPVPKGIRGADVLQQVRDEFGRECGAILWESKNTKNWSDRWLTKIRDDQREAKASLCAIVSIALPKECETIDCIDGVWVTSHSCLKGMSTLLRASLINESKAMLALKGKGEKMDVMYEYLCSPRFKTCLRGILDPFQQMKEDLEKEKRALQRQWKKREAELDRALNNLVGLWGEMQGIMGGEIGEIESLEFPALEAGQSDIR